MKYIDLLGNEVVVDAWDIPEPIKYTKRYKRIAEPTEEDIALLNILGNESIQRRTEQNSRFLTAKCKRDIVSLSNKRVFSLVQFQKAFGLGSVTTAWKVIVNG